MEFSPNKVKYKQKPGVKQSKTWFNGSGQNPDTFIFT